MNFLLLFWKPIAIAVVIGGLSVSLWVQNTRLASCKREFEVFKAEVKVLGDAQNAKTKLKDAENREIMEKANAENLRTKSALTIALNSLRSNPNSGRLPEAPASSKRPDLACFDRAEYQRAYGEFVKEIRGLADEGTESAIDLQTAKSWVRELK